MERISKLIEAIYAAPLEPDRWGQLAPGIARHFGAESCFIAAFNRETGKKILFAPTPNVDAGAQRDYEAYYYKTDLWVGTGKRVSLGAAFFGGEIVSERDLIRSEFYNDWCKRVGIFHALGFVASFDDAYSCVGVHRRFDAPRFDQDEKRGMALLLPHLTSALALTRRLETLRQDRKLALSAVDALNLSVMVVDAERRLLFANARAEALLMKRRGLAVSHGVLRATLPAHDAQLARETHQAALAAIGRARPASGVVTVPFEDGTTLSLMVQPLQPDAIGSGRRPVALIFAHDSDDEHLPVPETLARVYGLSPAEARLTASLVAGDRLETYAERVQISRETARTLLARVFRKTGWSRQTDLVRDVLTNPLLTRLDQSKARS